MNDLIMKFRELEIDDRFFFKDVEYRKIPPIKNGTSVYTAYSIDEHKYIQILDSATIHRSTF